MTGTDAPLERLPVLPAESTGWWDLQRLATGYRRLGAVFGVLVLAYAGLQALDIWVADKADWLAFLIGLAKPLVTALASSLLISWIVVRVQISWQRRVAHARLRVLGIARELESQQVAIVLPEFLLGDGAGAATGEAITRALGFPPADDVVRAKSAIGSAVYNRRDVLLMTDLVTMISRAGLPHPLVTSDHTVARALHEGRGGGPLTLTTGEHERDSRVISALIVVGLWSNVITQALSDCPDVPFALGPLEDLRRLTLTSSRRGDPFVREEDLARAGVEDPSGRLPPTTAALCRFYFADLKVVVGGGVRALGSARLGDLLLEPATRLPELWDVPATEEMWCLISCPGKRDRWGKYETVQMYRSGDEEAASRRSRIRLGSLFQA